MRRDLSFCLSYQSVHVLTARLLHHFAISTLTHHLRQHGKVIRNDGVFVIANFFCGAISLICTRHRELLLRRDLSDLRPSVHVLTARLLHHFAISTLIYHLRQHGKVIRNDGMVVTASFFCDAISLISTRHRELLLRRDLSNLPPSSRASFVKRSLFSSFVPTSPRPDSEIASSLRHTNTHTPLEAAWQSDSQ